MQRFGDMNWAAASGGKVRGWERMLQITEALRLRMFRRFRKAPAAIGAASADEVERMLRELELPATPLVHKAAELVTDLGPPALAAHALRTWAWGGVLALRDGLAHDRETFALSALLHDLALARRSPDLTCFAADGARQAVSLLTAWGASESTCRSVGDAICLHLRLAVPKELGAEAHLVHAGAALDVIGARLSDVPRELARRILELYPREGTKAFFADAAARECAAHPESRMALWVSLGFLDLIEKAPFEG